MARDNMSLRPRQGETAEDVLARVLGAIQKANDTRTTYECELPYPMYGEVGHPEPAGVEKIRELAFPVLVCRFEGETLASAVRRRDEINEELRAYGWPELGDLHEVERRGAEQ